MAEDTGITLGVALIFALLGGIVLNLMPCVLPVLSIKILSLIKHNHAQQSRVRWHGLSYTGGVLVSFVVIASLLIALRAGGAEIGWGFHLQSPVFVTLLAYLLFILGLSLSGLFTLSGTFLGLGANWAARSDYLGSFATGALAVVVATPCTAPFMGTAMGFALTQSWSALLLIFLTLGLGLALPYLLLCFSPSWLRFLPKPGAWMVRFKQGLAIPLYAAVIWLIWVLGQQTGLYGIAAALTGMVLIAVSLVMLQRLKSDDIRSRLVVRFIALAIVVLALNLPGLPARIETVSANSEHLSQGPDWESFSQTRLAALRAKGRPVFVNFTAAWCITCLVNEKGVLNSSKVTERFADKQIVYLKGDWTNQDPEITKALSAFGRSGVPLYLLYPPEPMAEPLVLPQILSEAILLRELNKL